MEIRTSISIISLLAVAVLALGYSGNAQRVRPGKVTSLQATTDKTGSHPATAKIAGPALITCMNAVSETPNAQPAPSCHIVAPGFDANVIKGNTAKATGAGDVTLTCAGRGYLRCDARIS
jgi:hypothetical protein